MMIVLILSTHPSFPDLKGQAPLRRSACSSQDGTGCLFLTSKVRLHCDNTIRASLKIILGPFPDLKGQAPLRHQLIELVTGLTSKAFPDLKGQAPLRRCEVAYFLDFPVYLFLTSKVRLHCDNSSRS